MGLGRDKGVATKGGGTCDRSSESSEAVEAVCRCLACFLDRLSCFPVVDHLIIAFHLLSAFVSPFQQVRLLWVRVQCGIFQPAGYPCRTLHTLRVAKQSKATCDMSHHGHTV